MQLQLDDDSSSDTKSPEVVSMLENLAEEWIGTVIKALAKEAKKTPNGNVSLSPNFNFLFSQPRVHWRKSSTGETGMPPCQLSLSS